MLRSRVTLSLPGGNPGLQTLRCYAFAHNKTHMGVDLDYGSIINHHESANTEAIGIKKMYYRVREFLMCESQCSKPMQHTHMHTHMHTHIDVCTHTKLLQCMPHTQYLSRPQKISRLDRKFLFVTAASSGFNVETYRTPVWTTPAQCGGRTSTRSHVAKELLRVLERTGDTAFSHAKLYHQTPF